MNKNIKHIFCGLFVATMVAMDAGATAARSAVNVERARAVGAQATTNPRAKQPVIMQRGGAASRTNSARNVAARTTTTPNRSTTSSRAARIISDAGDMILRRALGLSRSATPQPTVARTATQLTARSAVPAGASRARATAVFSDISKLGDGYNTCRTAYNTCMDQFCAGANETFRRCFCSNTFRTLRDKEEALDAATTMLAKFEDNNLNAVTKTAEEVNAMYTATAGEQAIKNDTSGAAALLNDIGDLLSGKKKASDTNAMSPLVGISTDFSADLGDIWGSSNSNSLFGSGNDTDLSALEGVELYNQAHTQCMQLVGSSCDAGAVRNMTKSAYSILITQDCNAYQKKLDSKTEQVKSTVRTAEKYLREARLEEYRSHNSADVNECMDKVETALTASTACGADYVRCLDYTGVYINSTTGEPIYSARLFGLNEIIQLDGSLDVLSQNPEFNKFLDSKRVFAKSALDTCRDMADTVWTEFKRNALIKISQAQDEKIEEVKMSCVNTMKECYDTQSGALKSFDDTTAQASGALAARASRDMCADKVLACAALYGDPKKCSVDPKTNRVTDKGGCGLSSLVNFVDTVDDVRIAEGCGSAIESYLKKLCTPSAGEEGYPWNCRLHKFNGSTGADKIDLNNIAGWTYDKGNNSSLARMVVNYAFENCGEKLNGGYKLDEVRSKQEVVQQLGDVHYALSGLVAQKCEAIDGLWIDGTDNTAGGLSTGNYLDAFYSTVFGKGPAKANEEYGVDSWGKCVKNDLQARCLLEDQRSGSNGWATYADGKCTFTMEYYKYQCKNVRGVWSSNRCYIQPDNVEE